MKSSAHSSVNGLYSERRTSTILDLPSSHSLKLLKNDLPKVDCGLKRHDVLYSDRSRHHQELLKTARSKDISYFYETIKSISPILSPIKDLMPYPLPSDLECLKQIFESKEFKTENLLKTINKPYSRRDAENLNDWLNEMHLRHLSKVDTIIEAKEGISQELANKIELIYLTAFKESIKQTATHCQPRAQMLLKILDVLHYTWKKLPGEFNRKVEVIKEHYHHELNKQKTMNELHHNSLHGKLEEVSYKLEESLKEKELLQNEISILKKYLSHMHSESDNKKPDSKFVLKVTLKPASFDKFVQTDKVVTESSEEISSDENPEYERRGDKGLGMFYSNQKTESLEKRHENINFLKKHLEIAKCTEEFNVEELYEYINKDFFDFYAWIDGFRLSSEYFLRKEQQEIRENQENEKEYTTESTAIKTEEKKHHFKDHAKILSFRYKPRLTVVQYIIENSPVDYILDYVCGLSPNKINKISKMALRKLSAVITNFLHLSKIKDFESFSTFGVFIYSEIFQKYSIKQIANRKFKELVACCIKYSDFPKVRIFLQMLGGGKGIGLSNFRISVIKFCLKIYDFMESDKTGIMTENPHHDIELYPTVRAFECIKHHLEERLPHIQIHNLHKKIMEISTNDPSDINKLGLIDKNKFVLLAVETFHHYTEDTIKSVKFATSSLTEYNYITLQEASLLLRNISKVEINKEEDALKDEFSQTEECEIGKFAQFCVLKGYLKTEETSDFFTKTELKVDKVEEKIKEIKEEVPEMVKKLENVVDTIGVEDWDSKLDDVAIWLRGKYSEKALHLWQLLKSEYKYLRSISL